MPYEYVHIYIRECKLGSKGELKNMKARIWNQKCVNTIIELSMKQETECVKIA